MNNKKKYIMSMVLFAVFLVMAVDIEGLGCPGDYILRALGMKAWSGGDTGLHLIAFYMIFPLLISGLELARYRRALEIGRLKSIILLVIVITLTQSIIMQIGVFIKSQSEGLYAVALIGEDNRYSMSRRDGVDEFELVVTIKNFSNNSQTFTIALDNRFRRRQGQAPIRVIDSTGNEAYFVLGPKDESKFHITSDQYKIHLSSPEENYSSISSSGDVSELIISNMDDGAIRIYENELRAEKADR